MLLHRIAVVAACVASVACAVPARADVVVPGGGEMLLDAGGLELACTDLIVAGSLHVDSAAVTSVRNFTIQPGGVVTATTGTISVGGAFVNQGTIPPGVVVFGNACGAGPGNATIPVPATRPGGLLLLAALLGAAALLSRRGLRP